MAIQLLYTYIHTSARLFRTSAITISIWCRHLYLIISKYSYKVHPLIDIQLPARAGGMPKIKRKFVIHETKGVCLLFSDL